MTDAVGWWKSEHGPQSAPGPDFGPFLVYSNSVLLVLKWNLRLLLVSHLHQVSGTDIKGSDKSDEWVIKIHCWVQNITNVSPSSRVTSMSMSLSVGFFRAGYMLNRLATKARLSLLFPATTSRGETNCRQSSSAACLSISSALATSSGS